mgnify:CR=1 FL=1
MAEYFLPDVNCLKELSCDYELKVLYPKDFEAKDAITAEIEKYNQRQKDSGKEENVINYTDIVGVMMKSVTQIVNTISYVLIAFVAISLVVSSIMIGIITYISVLERTKEIGILRAIGASKKDISRVFNCETFIVGTISGVLGIGVTVLLTIPINILTIKGIFFFVITVAEPLMSRDSFFTFFFFILCSR